MGNGVGIYGFAYRNIHYVGQTAQLGGFDGRWGGHLSDLRNGVKHTRRLLNDYKKYKGKPQFYVIEECSVDKLDERERYWFYLFRDMGIPLYNGRLDPVTNRGVKLTVVQRQAASVSAKARMASDKGVRQLEDARVKARESCRVNLGSAHFSRISKLGHLARWGYREACDA